MTERAFAILLPLAILAPALQAEEQEPGLEERLRLQGEELEKLKQEVKDLRGRDVIQLEKDINAYLETTSAEVQPRTPAYRNLQLFGTRVRIGGYMSLELRDDGEDSNLRFDFHRLVLRIGAEIADGISFDSEIEIEGGGADVSFLTGNEILVEYAEIRWEFIEDLLVFKAGALLVPWGRFNKYHDDPYQDLTDRPLVSRRIGAVAFDQPGIGFEGSVEFAGDSGWFLDYDFAVTQGFGEATGRAAELSDRQQQQQAGLGTPGSLGSRAVLGRLRHRSVGDLRQVGRPRPQRQLWLGVRTLHQEGVV